MQKINKAFLMDNWVSSWKKHCAAYCVAVNALLSNLFYGISKPLNSFSYQIKFLRKIRKSGKKGEKKWRSGPKKFFLVLLLVRSRNFF